ncbi:MAG: hypothetical protein DRI34_07280 [Deltaproteobacteria bacterium]|nr:MAG: hypothetical protein DRI34_07280 [Deltaproteobacteria bacterium]
MDERRPQDGRQPEATEEEQQQSPVANQAREFLARFQKGIKSIALYRHDATAWPRYLEPARQALTEVFQDHQQLPLAVEQGRLLVQGVTVYQQPPSDQNLAFLLYRDGIRLLTFRSGTSSKELVDLALAFLREPEVRRDGQDMVSLLWQQDFKHIDYVVVDSFALGKSEDEEARQDIDKIVTYLVSRLSGSQRDGHRYARVSLDDVELEVTDVQQASGVVLGADIAGEEQRLQIQKEIEQFDRHLLARRTGQLLLEVLQEELAADLAEPLLEAFGRLFDTHLLNEDLDSLHQLFQGLQALDGQALSAQSQAWAASFRQILRERLGEPATIDRLGDILEKRIDQATYRRIFGYLVSLGSESLENLLNTLERLNRSEARRLFCEVLVQLGRDHTQAFASRLLSAKANMVRDMLFVLEKLSPPELLTLKARLLRHPNLAIRLEAIKSMARSNDLAAGNHLVRALKDEDAQIRATAARLLASFDPALAQGSLLDAARQEDFCERPDREQVAVFSALSQIDSPQVASFLRQTLHSSSLLGRKRLEQTKKNLLAGMVDSASLAAFRLLRAELAAGLKPAELSRQAQRACERLKERLLRSQEQDK